MTTETRHLKIKKIHVIGGGTVSHVRPHFALCAPAYGETARKIARGFSLYREDNKDADPDLVYLVKTHLTKMAGGGPRAPETNEDVDALISDIVADSESKIVVMSAALCDYTGYVIEGDRDHRAGTKSGKDQPRLKTSDGGQEMRITPAEKIIKKIRAERKDIFLVGFKTTAGADERDQYIAGLTLLKNNSCNLVFANDVQTRRQMIITPEQARYGEDMTRDQALEKLIYMTMKRSQNRFTRSTVVKGKNVQWSDSRIPESLRKVVDYCIEKNAYKPFPGKSGNWSTVGHFAFKLSDSSFITSRRSTNFNSLGNKDVGMVRIDSEDDDRVIAHGSRPSVGGQSQRIIFSEHPDFDCIVHAHVPLREGSEVPVRSQAEYECGSHECGKNTSDGLQQFGNIKAVFLDKHGPNIVFNHKTDPEEVIRFIEENFDLRKATDGILPLWERDLQHLVKFLKPLDVFDAQFTSGRLGVNASYAWALQNGFPKKFSGDFEMPVSCRMPTNEQAWFLLTTATLERTMTLDEALAEFKRLGTPISGVVRNRGSSIICSLRNTDRVLFSAPNHTDFGLCIFSISGLIRIFPDTPSHELMDLKV